MAFPASLPLSLPVYTNLYSASQVRELDRTAIEDFGVPGIRLMRRAGRALFDEILERYPEISHLYVFCGAGNNGGDGYIVAGLAKQKNIQVTLVETAAEKLKGDAATARSFALAQAVEPVEAGQWLKQPEWPHDALVVDALLGTGFSGELRAPYSELIDQINTSGLPVFAADIPSGLSADTGSVSNTVIRADVTVTFIGLKVGLFTGQGRGCSGDIVVDDLQVPNEIYSKVPSQARLLDYDELLDLLPPREQTSHKGSHGHLLVAGGDLSLGGAPLMAAEAAARMGAGLVSVITRPEHRPAIVSRCPEIMVCDAGDVERVKQLIDKASAIVIGPGLGTEAWGQKLLQQVLAANTPMVVDADALNLLATGQFAQYLPLKNSVITPHPGEAGRLLGLDSGQVNQNRIEAVRQLQAKHSAVALLKGSGTLIASATEIADQPELSLCPYGNPGMGSGGMGDVLSGIIGSLLAQGFKPVDAAKFGSCVHAYAADILVEEHGERGLMATDLINEVRRLVNGI